jgi:tRNA dimethylallyltransferase
VSENKDKYAIILTGPTAAGKTSIAIQLAQYFDTEIISADSRQCYKELNIGVARPSRQDLETVPHHFIASHSVFERIDAAIFEKYALKKAENIFKEKKAVIIAGGTGLYIRSFCEGLDAIPETEPDTRERIVNNYNEKGLKWLQQELKLKDPEFYNSGEIRNPQRMMRALEVVESTGKSILYFRKGKQANRDFTIIKTGLDLPKTDLHRNINNRIDKMMEDGLLNEVNSLIHLRHLNALQTVGYSELFEYLDGQISLEKAVEKIKTNTRQYAKRQITWFKKDEAIQWFSPFGSDEIIKFINQAMDKK